VRDETLDFAICRRAVLKLDSGLAFRPLFRNDFAVVARKGHPLEKARSLAQLAEAKLDIAPSAGRTRGAVRPRVFAGWIVRPQQ